MLCPGLPVEILRAGGDCVLQHVLKICSSAYDTETVPSDWKKGVILVNPLLKKGEKTLCDNYRGITLLTHCVKIYSRIFERRLRSCVEDVLDDSQYCFRPNRGTTDAIFIVKMMLEKSWEWGIDKLFQVRHFHAVKRGNAGVPMGPQMRQRAHQPVR